MTAALIVVNKQMAASQIGKNLLCWPECMRAQFPRLRLHAEERDFFNSQRIRQRFSQYSRVQISCDP